MSVGVLLPFVVGLNVYALALIYLRSWLYRVPVYRPMVKNFVLSVLPLVIFAIGLMVVALIAGTLSRGLGIAAAIVVFVVWLLALPNSSYLITELNLNHRRENESVPLWYDIISVLSFAMSGIVNTVLAVLVAQLVLVVAVYGDNGAAVNGTTSVVLVVVVTALVSVGIYLGRYLRLNSWDVRSPARMVAKVREHFDTRAAWGNFALFCLTHTVFLLLVYGLIAGPLLESLAHTANQH